MKNWTNEELIVAIQEIKNGKTYEEIAVILNRTYSSVRVKLIKEKHGRQLFIDKLGKDYHNCLNCDNKFLVSRKRKRERKFCSKSCSASYNNKLRCKKITEKIKNTLLNKEIIIKEKLFCLYCNTELNRNQRKFCSNHCQSDYQRTLKVKKWLNGELTGMKSENSTVNWIKWFLKKERGEKCEECGWNKTNPYTNTIPIELEHMDGNHKNNKIENLKLLCPGCHSLTPTYKGANKGNGRHNRRKRYKEGKSY